MTGNTKASTATDPRPLPPIAPAPDRCCTSGCGDACVEEVYLEEMRIYRAELLAWEARQLGAE